jgi:nitroreductase
MENNFSVIAANIKNRRTIKTAMMNGHKIPNAEVAALLELADWAPTHGLTEPWRFVVFEDPKAFCLQHAELYKEHTLPENFKEATVTNLTNIGNNASHVVVAVMKKGTNPNIPAVEEIAATAASVQNILLAAASLNIACFWSTGGMTLRPAFKPFLGFEDQDQVLGIIYLGYTDEHPEGKRRIPLEEKIKWIKN